MTAVSNSFAPQSLRVLLFEDNPLDAALIKKFLLTVGMRSTNIHHVDTIPSALQVLSSVLQGGDSSRFKEEGAGTAASEISGCVICADNAWATCSRVICEAPLEAA